MKTTTKMGLGVVGALALALTPALNAWADGTGASTDIVGVGSDTVQFIGDFLANGDVAGDVGYNATNPTARMINFDASGDGYGIATTGAGVVLRAGQKPSLRPDGSGPGYDALDGAAASANETVNYSRASGTPSSTQLSAADALFHGYHVYRVATDNIQIAVSGNVASNVPTQLTIAELVKLYKTSPTTAGDLSTCPTFSATIGRGGSTPVAPLIPQTGSGTGKTFLADLVASNGAAFTLGGCVTTVQEHDPTPVENNPNAFDPFSSGRAGLIGTGYFSADNITSTAVSLQSGGSAYVHNRSLYFIIRQDDFTSNAPFVTSLFKGRGAFLNGTSASALISAAGVTPSVSDCGNDTFC